MTTIAITILLGLTILNIVLAFINYENENYKSAMLSSFAAGFVASAIIANFIFAN